MEGFALPVAAMASEQACERVAYEVAQDAWQEGCVLGEFRMAPQLFEPFGLSAHKATEAMLRGLARSDLTCGLIVCGMRHHEPDVTKQAALIAAAYMDQGVCGFDLAGPERGFPAARHEQAIVLARQAELGVTLHAGEADTGANVLDAIRLGATRIGHGVQVVDDPHWIEQARSAQVHFEVCPSSNLHTGATASLAAHPIHRMVQEGLSVSVSTDNRLISGTTLCDELTILLQELNFSMTQIAEMQRQGLKSSFLSQAQRSKVQHHFSE